MGVRAGILIGSSLIFCIGGTLLIMQFMGVGLNRTSLAAFIIAMGMLVDNAIVVTDNAQIAIKRGIRRRQALDRRGYYASMGIAGGYDDRRILFSAFISGAIFRSGNDQTFVYCVGRFFVT